MLSRRHRFHRRNSLRAVYQGGQTLRGPMMTLKFKPQASKGPYRVAVVVSKKVHKSAVTRNRIRRRVYEAVRQTHLDLPDGLDMIFTIFSDQVATLEYDRLQKNITDLLQKAVKS